jgi:hypothetical protein
MAALYDSLILVLLILVFIGFVLLQKEPPVPPIIRPRIKEKFQSGGSGSGGNSLIRTTEMAAANATICNLQPLYDSLQCAVYIARNGPTPPVLDASVPSLTGRRPTTNYLTNAEGGSGLTLPSVAITGSITNLGTIVSITGGDPTPFVKPNDMIYLGYMIDVQGPYVVASVAANAITLSKKYVGPNLTNTILSVIPTAMSGSAGQTTPVLEDVSNPSDSGGQPEVYSIGRQEFAQQTQAQAACVALGGTLATTAQLRTALNNGANWDELGWISDDGNNKYSPRQTPVPTLYVTTAGSGAAICYGVKPSAQTAYTGYTNSGNPVYPTPFSSTSYYDPQRYSIVGTVLPGTSYINTKNTKLPYALGIGDLVYLNGSCNVYTGNRYDTDNGDGTCTAYDCNLGEVDLLDGTCQRYSCKTGDTTNGDGTCTTPVIYYPCMASYTSSYVSDGRLYCSRSNSVFTAAYYSPIKIQPYVYDMIKNGTKLTTYVKTSNNPTYKYSKSLGPYYIAANPAIGKIMIRSKSPGDLDANGNFTGITSYRWTHIAGSISSICYANNQLYFIDASKKKVFYMRDVRNPLQVTEITGDSSTYIYRYRYLTFCRNTTVCSVGGAGELPLNVWNYINATGLEINGRMRSYIKETSYNRCRTTKYSTDLSYTPGAETDFNHCINSDPGDILFNTINVDIKNSNTYKIISVVPQFDATTSSDPAGYAIDNPSIPIKIYPFFSNQDTTRAINWSTGGPPNAIGQITSNGKTLIWSTTQILYNPGMANGLASVYSDNPGFKLLTLDGFNGTIMALKNDNTVWYLNTPGAGAARIWPQQWTQLTADTYIYISHSNGKWVGITTNGIIYYLSSYLDYTRKMDITQGLLNAVQVSFDANAMSVAVLTTSSNVFYRYIGNSPSGSYNTESVINKIPLTGLSNVSINKALYSTGGSGSKVSLNKSVVGCSIGTYGPSCTACADGTSSTTVGALSCRSCAANQYSVGGMPCTNCPENYVSDPSSAYCSPCEANMQSISGQNCTPCPAGQTSVAGQSCSQCVDGTIGSDGACSIMGYLLTGTTKINITTNIVELSPTSNAQWLSLLKARIPTSLTNGTYTSTATTITINSGWAAYGYINENPISRMRLDTTPYSGSQSPIRANTYFVLVVKTANLTYSASRYPLISGTALPLKICPSGYCCDAGSYSVQYSDVCQSCNAGQYSSAGASQCQNCAAGQYSSAGAAQCQNCAAGKYSSAGAAQCQNCAAGQYSSAGAAQCQNCPAGQYSSAGGSCLPCAKLTYSVAGSASCSPCTIINTVSLVAGQYLAYGNINGPSTSASFNSPRYIAIHSNNNIYLSDYWNNAIRIINTSTNTVSTLATNGPSPTIYGPTGLVFNSDYSILYVSNMRANTILAITISTGYTVVLAGNGAVGYTNGIGGNAVFNKVHGMCIDITGNLYVCDTDNSVIRMITPTGTVSTFAGSPGVAGYADGIATNAIFKVPCDIKVTSDNIFYVADSGNALIRKITSTAVVSTFSGIAGSDASVDGLPGVASFRKNSRDNNIQNGLLGLTIDSVNNIYVSDNTTVRKITPSGLVSTIAGIGLSPPFSILRGIVTVSSGDLYVVDGGLNSNASFNNCLRKINNSCNPATGL